MKLNIGKRILLFVHWLLSLAVAVVFFATQLVGRINEAAGTWVTELIARIPQPTIVFAAAAAVYLIFSIVTVCIVCERDGNRGDRGFIVMDSSDSGRVRIAVSAVEQMVKQAIGTVEGITDMKISITAAEDAININVNASIVGGSHVPTVTVNMQRAIRQFVEMNCGVAVRSVAINIQSVANTTEGGHKGKRNAEPAAPVQPVWSSAPAAPEAPAPVIPAMSEEPASVYAEQPVYGSEKEVYSSEEAQSAEQPATSYDEE